MGFGGPRSPWDAPGGYATMYEPDAVPPPIPGRAWPLGARRPAAARMRAGRLDGPQGMGAADCRRLRANYFGKVTLIDRWIGTDPGRRRAPGMA